MKSNILPPDHAPYLPPALAALLERGELHISYRKAKAEHVITGLERPINQHLLKRLTVETDEDTARHWRRELLSWLDEVADIRLKPEKKTANSGFYFRILFDEPFGGTEVASVGRRLSAVDFDGDKLRDGISAGKVAADFEAIHRRFAAGCAAGTWTRDSIGAFLDEIGQLAR